MSVIINPIEQYFNLDGSPLTNGYLYFGVPFGNPVTEPSAVYFDPEFTIPAAQPVRTVNGYPVRSGTATGLFAPDDVSILVQNSAKEQVIYIESSSVSAVQTNTFYRDSNILLTADDNNKTFIATLPFTQTIDASVALGSSWSIQFVNMSNGLIIFDPNLSETIDGQATVSLQPNRSIYIRCDGVNLETTLSPYPLQSVVAASSLDLTVTKSKLVSITGVTTVNSVLMIDGDEVKAIVGSVFQLTNSSSLIVQGGANYTTTINDILTFTKDGSGNIHVEIQKIDGKTISPQSDKIFDIDASVAGNNLTITVNAGIWDFRSTTLTDGTPVTRTLSTPISLVVPNGATLGTVNAISARYVVGLLDDAGTLEPFVINIAGGNQLDETNLITTTTISTGADSNNVAYSTTGRTTKAYRIVGFIDITEATAGVYATAPTLVQGCGGQALASLSSFGYGQTLQNVAGSRTSGTIYYNTTGKPIFVFVQFSASGGGATVGGVQLIGTVGGNITFMCFAVPAGMSYSATISSGAINGWTELR